MKKAIQISFVILMVLTFYYAGKPDQKDEKLEPKVTIKIEDSKAYGIETEPETRSTPTRGPLKYQPDYSVEVYQGGTEMVQQPTSVLHQGKRYRVVTKPDGTIELKPWR